MGECGRGQQGAAGQARGRKLEHAQLSSHISSELPLVLIST